MLRPLRHSHVLRVMALALLAVLAYAAYATAAGTPSPGFGANGIAQVGAAARINAVAVQDDGRPVVAGYSGNNMLVQRLGTNGAPEAAFNAGPGVALGVAVAPDGKIVAAGRNNPNTAIAQNGNMVVRRFNSDGTLDTSFGTNGTVTLGGTQ